MSKALYKPVTFRPYMDDMQWVESKGRSFNLSDLVRELLHDYITGDLTNTEEFEQWYKEKYRRIKPPRAYAKVWYRDELEGREPTTPNDMPYPVKLLAEKESMQENSKINSKEKL
ncbi:MAG TPA: hypothetical protein VF077_10885 [Nitrospiraceae bacterium]